MRSSREGRWRDAFPHRPHRSRLPARAATNQRGRRVTRFADPSLDARIREGLDIVLRRAQRFTRNEDFRDDLTGAGAEAVVRAARVYNPAFGVPWSAFVTIAVRREMAAEAGRQRGVRLPRAVARTVRAARLQSQPLPAAIYDTRRRKLVPVVIVPVPLDDDFNEVCAPSPEEQLLAREAAHARVTASRRRLQRARKPKAA